MCRIDVGTAHGKNTRHVKMRLGLSANCSSVGTHSTLQGRPSSNVTMSSTTLLKIKPVAFLSLRAKKTSIESVFITTASPLSLVSTHLCTPLKQAQTHFIGVQETRNVWT
eukprot:TRINITY_DN21850_c0_g2_i1.p2 TRINITY_DN21850_c0_g2~~TRINITY_DN21850_c0_g2_i1.p2  ORF type:complete len:110 (+),score=8.23 TRINITY_DN21850_c0_g2_i1:234-563(+)